MDHWLVSLPLFPLLNDNPIYNYPVLLYHSVESMEGGEDDSVLSRHMFQEQGNLHLSLIEGALHNTDRSSLHWKSKLFPWPCNPEITNLLWPSKISQHIHNLSFFCIWILFLSQQKLFTQRLPTKMANPMAAVLVASVVLHHLGSTVFWTGFSSNQSM